MSDVPSVFDLTPDELRARCESADLPSYAGKQILEWVWRHGVVDPSAMTNLSRAARDGLGDVVRFYDGSELTRQDASDGTRKILVGWPDRRQSLPVIDPANPRSTECVMIPTPQRRTACVSSQVGCPVGCRFCASGLDGLESNLTTGQIVEQVHRLSQLDTGRITNVVFMGMGEPLANYAAVTRAIRTLVAPWGAGISARKITVSTVGLPAAIRKLVDFDIPVTLALSLHAPTDDLRRELIPWAEYSTIPELIDACDEYFQSTGREITLEYLLLRNVNDRPHHASALADVAQRTRANVNLIRYNEVRGLPYDRPTTTDVHAFQAVLKRRGVNAHIRASRGRDIAAACGQLAKQCS